MLEIVVRIYGMIAGCYGSMKIRMVTLSVDYVNIWILINFSNFWVREIATNVHNFQKSDMKWSIK